MGKQNPGKGHNSLTGQEAVMGLSSGKYWTIQQGQKGEDFVIVPKPWDKKPKAHDCQKNHKASSKAMEPATAVELFNKAPDHSVKFSVYTGEDDSTTEARIREKVTCEVEKRKNSDIIHIKRSLKTRHLGIYRELEIRLKPRKMVILCALHEN